MRQFVCKYRIPSFYLEDVRDNLLYRYKKINFVRKTLYGKRGVRETGILRTDINAPLIKRRRRTSFGWIFMFKQKMKYFYYINSELYFKKLMKSLRRRRFRFADWSNIFLSQLESRLDLLLFRLNFVKTIIIGRYLISRGAITVQQKIQKQYTCTLKFMHLFTISYNYKNKVRDHLIDLLRRERIRYKYPKYLECSLKTFYVILYKPIKATSIFYSFKPFNRLIKVPRLSYFGNPYWAKVHTLDSSRFGPLFFNNRNYK